MSKVQALTQKLATMLVEAAAVRPPKHTLLPTGCDECSFLGLSLVVPSHFILCQPNCVVFISRWPFSSVQQRIEPNGMLIGSLQENAFWHYHV